jgi:aminocarboxymuconate-semialdehyde decarboxylase
MGDVKASLDELKRAIDVLGLVGVAMGSNIAGAPLNHPDFEPLWGEINARKLPVVEHPMLPLGTEHMDEFELPIRVGFMYETTTALTRMIYAGIFERYADFPFIVAHTGGALLTLLERLDNGYRIFPDCRKNISRLPSEYARQLYYDTCCFFGPALMSARDIVGSQRLLWGSDDPFIGADLSHVESLAIPDEEKALILGDNAAKIFLKSH